jgi:acetylornithine deacetylase/succinyl-diaminopimelate desuccinylase-like protein
MTINIDSSLDQSFNETVEILKDFVRIPFVSHGDKSSSEYTGLMEKSANFVSSQFEALGFDVKLGRAKVEDDSRDGNVAIVGQLGANADRSFDVNKKTILLYAHHDVQPVQNPDNWETPCFEPTVIDTPQGQRMFGRGAADDGAGIAAHIGAVKLLQSIYPKGSELPVNLKLYIEGEEEIGSPSFANFIADFSDELKADVIIVADSGNWAVGTPAITSSLRGVATIELELKVLDHAIHSGMSSGPIIDANSLLMKTISSIWDNNGEITVDGLLGAVQADGSRIINEPTVDYTEEDYRRDNGVLEGVELAGSGTISGRIWYKPSVTVIGFDAVRTSDASNVFAPKSAAVLSLRVVPGQDPREAAQFLIDHLGANVPLNAKFEAKINEAGPAFQADLESPGAIAFRDALTEGFGKEVVYSGMGGSIPFTADLKRVFPNAEILLAGVEDPDSRAHSDNESVHLGDLKKVIKSQYLLFEKLGA